MKFPLAAFKIPGLHDKFPMDFHLTDYSELRGCGCKVPRDSLLTLLTESRTVDATNKGTNDEPDKGNSLGIGLDSCVVPLEGTNHHSLVQTVDFFAPLVDHPYLQGRIAAANVLSDLYAMGVYECSSVLSILCICKDLPLPDTLKVVIDKEQLETARLAFRDSITLALMSGFQDAVREAGSRVLGGQTIFNPWYLVGGCATGVVTDCIWPFKAREGQVLILTKPLGTQVATNAHSWLHRVERVDPNEISQRNSLLERLQRLEDKGVSKKDFRESYDLAIASMMRLNLNTAKLMMSWKYRKHIGAATDVTGFGLLGHASNLARLQEADVDFLLERWFLLPHVLTLNTLGWDYGLLKGTSAETSGGLLIAIDKDVADDFIEDLYHLDGWPAFIIGKVIIGQKKAKLADSMTVINV